ncbi:putative phage tail protein [Paucisalibacillus globulus]|uniref:putative phage tail protein n=1 Tax=Paucisalibacillus globulus TaxID=351095 RepID=UPI000BB68CC3|nr:putative phage tail protein [Paucisalibacillus globulus]
MARDVDILSYLPPVLHQVKEVVEIANVEKNPLEATWEAIEQSLNNRFILTADEEGLARQEKMLKINVPATDTIETRRFRLLTRYQEQAPYSNSVLKQLLDSLLGENGYVMTRDIAGKKLKVKIELTVKGQFDAVVIMLERITPQNMILTVELRYNQHSLLSQFTHAQLAAFTHKQLREDVLT